MDEEISAVEDGVAAMVEEIERGCSRKEIARTMTMAGLESQSSDTMKKQTVVVQLYYLNWGLPESIYTRNTSTYVPLCDVQHINVLCRKYLMTCSIRMLSAMLMTWLLSLEREKTTCKISVWCLTG